MVTTLTLLLTPPYTTGKCPNVITPALTRHCTDNQKVLALHHSPAISPLSLKVGVGVDANDWCIIHANIIQFSHFGQFCCLKIPNFLILLGFISYIINSSWFTILIFNLIFKQFCLLKSGVLLVRPFKMLKYLTQFHAVLSLCILVMTEYYKNAFLLQMS